MSNYYFNEKKGRYEHIDEASAIKKQKINIDKQNKYRSEPYFQETQKTEKQSVSMPTFEIPKARKTEGKDSKGKKKKGGIGSIIGVVWVLYILFNGDIGDKIREFFESIFGWTNIIILYDCKKWECNKLKTIVIDSKERWYS